MYLINKTILFKAVLLSFICFSLLFFCYGASAAVSGDNHCWTLSLDSGGHERSVVLGNNSGRQGLRRRHLSGGGQYGGELYCRVRWHANWSKLNNGVGPMPLPT